MKQSYFTVRLLIVLFFIQFSCSSPKQENYGTHAPEWSRNATIYELNIRQFSKEGTFKAVEKRLDELKSLGVDIIWLMPIHPIGEKNRKGSMGSYYAVKDYLDVNPEFGTKDDFRTLVQAIHSKGMKVIIDWVANHTAWDNPLTQSHPEWYTKNEKGEFVPPVEDWEDVIDLAYEIPDEEGNLIPNMPLWNYKVDALTYWVQEFDIDGYRCDVADMVPYAFWVKARKALDFVKPVFMLAEAETPKLHDAAFDASYSWRMHHVFNHIAQGKESPEKIREYLDEDAKNYPKGSLRMVFTDNHDENSWNGTVFERLGDAAEVFAALTFTIESTPLIYNGQESGLNKRLAFFEKDEIDWKKHPLREVYSSLATLKKEYPVLADGGYGGAMKYAVVNKPSKFMVFTRELNGQKVLAIFNLTDQPGDVHFQSVEQKGMYRNYFTGEEQSINSSHELKLPAWGWQILVSK